MARVWRDGQKKTVHIYRLLTAGKEKKKASNQAEYLLKPSMMWSFTCKSVSFLPRHYWGAYISETGVQTGAVRDCGWLGESSRTHKLLHQRAARSFQPDGHAVFDPWPAELQLQHGRLGQRYAQLKTIYDSSYSPEQKYSYLFKLLMLQLWNSKYFIQIWCKVAHN